MKKLTHKEIGDALEYREKVQPAQKIRTEREAWDDDKRSKKKSTRKRGRVVEPWSVPE
jgi:hypothetical protein